METSANVRNVGALATRTDAPAVTRAGIVAALAACMALPLAAAYFLAGESLRLDEAQSLWQTSRSITDLFAIVAGDVHVPLYHLLLHFWRLLTGDGVLNARFFSFIFFELSIPALYLLAAHAYSRRVALYATLLFALSPFVNWYAMEIRMYTLFVFLTILNQYCFVRIFKNGRSNEGIWALYALTALAGIFTHYFFFLILLAQAVFYGLRREQFPAYAFRRFALSALIVIASFTPWAWYVYQSGTASFEAPALTAPTSVNLFSAFSQFLFGFQNDGVNTIVLSLWPVLVIFGLLTLRRHSSPRPETEYLVVSILVPFTVAFVASIFLMPVFLSRYLIFTLPALYLLIASMFSIYSPRMRLTAEGLLVALAVVTLASQIASPATAVKEHYREAATYLTAQASPQDVVILSAPFTIYPVQYYYRGVAPITTLPLWNQYAYGPIPNLNESDLPEQVAKATDSYQNAYILLSYDQGYEDALKRYFDSRYERLSEREFSDGLMLYVYRLRYNTEQSAITTRISP